MYFLINGFETNRKPLEKDENESKPRIEINFKWIRDPNIKHKAKGVLHR